MFNMCELRHFGEVHAYMNEVWPKMDQLWNLP